MENIISLSREELKELITRPRAIPITAEERRKQAKMKIFRQAVRLQGEAMQEGDFHEASRIGIKFASILESWHKAEQVDQEIEN